MIEPSPFEKAQAEAIANAVRACGFESTPELIAKLERKRRHYGVTGFVVASAIGKAFKRVQGTSNEPDRQKPGWITVVVENDLRGSTQPAGTERRGIGRMEAAIHPKWTPKPPAFLNPATRTAPDRTLQFAPDNDQDEHAAHGVPTSKAVVTVVTEDATPNTGVPALPRTTACGLCGSDGVVNGTAPAIWCDCDRGRQKRRAQPNYVDVLNRSAWHPGAMAAARRSVWLTIGSSTGRFSLDCLHTQRSQWKPAVAMAGWSMRWSARATTPGCAIR